MALSRPTDGIGNIGDVTRLALAAETCVSALATDLRVREHYMVWQQRHGLDRLIVQLRAYQTAEGIHAFGAALDSDTAGDVVALQRLVHDLGLSYTWLPPPLLALYRVSAYSEATGEALTVAIRVPSGLPLPPGRKPPRDGRDIVRNVWWWYRARVKQPRDEVSALAREWNTGAKRSDKSRSRVHEGIEQAETLLNLVVADWNELK
jgi:hypothetical protein